MSEICSSCGLPKDLCVCESIAKDGQSIKVYFEKRKFRKMYTIVEGIEDKQIDIKDLVKKLKNKFACGGTVKNGTIELQGNHCEAVKSFLKELGFAVQSK